MWQVSGVDLPVSKRACFPLGGCEIQRLGLLFMFMLAFVVVAVENPQTIPVV